MSKVRKEMGVEEEGPFCWEIKGCSEAERSNCEAYKARKNCWEVAGTALDSGQTAMCETCPVILSRIACAIAQAMSTAPRRRSR